MANHLGIAAVGCSIERYLNHCFAQLQPIDEKTTKAVLCRTEDLDHSSTTSNLTLPAAVIYLYRIGFNATMRAAWSQVGFFDGRAHLPVDLHYLVIPFAGNADYELRIAGRVLQCMESTPIMSGPLLDSFTNWAPNEAIEICLEDVSTEDIMRIYDSLPIDFKLSIPYMARVLCIDGTAAGPDTPVTTSQLGIKPGVSNG